MVFINTGSRRDVNPYSSRGGGILACSKLFRAISPKVLGALSAVVAIWLLAIALVVRENPEIKKEVLNDIQREEALLKGKLRRGRMRAKEWLRNKLDGAPEVIAKQRQHEWDLAQLEDLALRTGPDDTPIHMVFSTDCSPYQHWQAYQFFLSALRIRQPGRITQIASGCTTEEEKKAIQDWFAEHIAPLSLRFGLHLTPLFSSVKDESGNTVEYEFFNKPFGLKHWMQHGEGMGIDPSTQQPWKHDTIIALLDPDQVLIKPITGYVSSPDDIFRRAPSDNESQTFAHNVDSPLSYQENEPHFLVRHGHPLAQEYGMRDAWRKYASVAGPDSPATSITSNEALVSYAVGPPYVATALDVYTIAVDWCEFVPKVHKLFPQLMAEMYAYSISAAHNRLPHQLTASYMISDTVEDQAGGEGWKFVDEIPGDEVCSFALNSLDADIHSLPAVLHFCHRYGVGDHAFFTKKKLPKDFFSCDSPLLEEPAMDIGSGKYLYKKPPFRDDKVQLSAVVEKREAFMICSSIGFLNEAALFFKYRHCGDDANLKKEISLHDLPE